MSSPYQIPLYEQFLVEKEQDDANSSPRSGSCLSQLKFWKPPNNPESENSTAEPNDGRDSSTSFLGRTESNQNAQQNPPVSKPEAVYGFKNEELWLVRSIIKPGKDNFKAIGVVGMREFGKTELCRLVFNNDYVKQHFAPRIWVNMSSEKQPTQEKVAEIILRQLDVEEELIHELLERTGLHYALYLKLVGKRYLIVIDNVEEGNNRNGFCSIFPKGSGGAVIVTVRNKKAAEEMVGKEEEENIYFPQPIADADSCWKIYNSALKKEFKVGTPTDELKKEVRKKSGGLPVAVKLMGDIKNEQREAEKERPRDEQGKEDKVGDQLPRVPGERATN